MEYAILGGGALGLMAAYRLTQAGHAVMVFEQEKIAGGLAAGFRVGDDAESWLEKFYHHLFRTDKTAISTIKELGLGDYLTWSHPRTVTLTGGEIHQLDSPLNLLLFPPLRFDERLRVFAVLAFLKLVNSAPLEGKTADAWLRRWMGKRPYAMLFETLFVGKFGALREQKEEMAGLFAGNPKRQTAQPTAERLLEAFGEVTLTVVSAPGFAQRHVTPLSPLQQQIWPSSASLLLSILG